MAFLVSVDDLNAAKDKGNYHFQQKNYKDAIVAYGKGLSKLEEHKVEELTGDHIVVQSKLAANQCVMLRVPIIVLQHQILLA